MSDDRITNESLPAGLIRPALARDSDPPVRRETRPVKPPLRISEIVMGAVIGGLLGCVVGGVLGAKLVRNNVPFVFLGGVIGLCAGGVASVIASRGRLGKGKRVIDRALPRELHPASPPPQPVAAAPGPMGIMTLPAARKLFASALPRQVSQFGGHHGAITAVALGPDGRLALTAGIDGMVSLWDVRSGFEIRSMQAFRESTPSVAFSLDGRLLLACGVHSNPRSSVSPEGGAFLWDAESGQLLRQLDFKDRPRCAAFLPGGREIVLGCDDYLRAWELEGPTPTAIIDLRGEVLVGEEICSVATSRTDSRLVLAGCHTSQMMRLVNLERGEVVRNFEGHRKRGPGFRRAAVMAVAFSPDEMQAVSGSLDQTARVWNLLTGESISCFEGHRGWWGWRGVIGVAWLGEDRVLTASEYGLLCIWNPHTAEEYTRLEHGSSIRCLATSPDRRLALTGGNDGVVRVWDLERLAVT